MHLPLSILCVSVFKTECRTISGNHDCICTAELVNAGDIDFVRCLVLQIDLVPLRS
ncbi:hypothetical protein PHET_10578 [Paragonimus heterotremus]|uniref:Uncharacterized protein n=1 Tax=Paragonimus heterotremus TaxID=100268 RepID=A0A8J4SK33_9TREM|nr:hypothetical protein PHET_10578 [Paragonimus heterotremus]